MTTRYIMTKRLTRCGSSTACEVRSAHPQWSGVAPPEAASVHSVSAGTRSGLPLPVAIPRNELANVNVPHLERLRNRAMTRVATAAFLMLAGATATLPPLANAQSPNPATIAPSRSGLAPATPPAPSPQPRNPVPDPAPGGNTVQAPSEVAPAPSIITPGAPSTSGAGSRSGSRSRSPAKK
jgi:hypothetical protein